MNVVDPPAKIFTLKQHVTYPLTRLSNKMTAQAARLLRRYSELSLSEWRLMIVIDAKGQASLAEITRFLDFDKGQMSRVSRNLIRRGLLQSTPSESDQRAQILSLTAAGRDTFERAAPHMKRRREFLLESLTAAEQRQFFHIVDKLNRAADEFEAML